MKLWSAGELAKAEFEEPPYLVDPIIPLGGTTMLHGKRQVGKSLFATTLAHSVTHGYPFLGRWPVEQGPVVFIQVDMTPQIQQLRIRQTLKTTDMDGVFFTFPQTLDITRMDMRMPRLIETINEAEPVLIIWDTLRRIHRLNEDKSASVQRVYGQMRDFFPHISHLPAHHDRKSPADPRMEPDPEEDFRGSGDWIDSADTSIQLRSVAKRSPPRLRMHVHKSRTASEAEKKPIVLELDPKSMLLRPVEGPLYGPAAEAEDARTLLQEGTGTRARVRRARKWLETRGGTL